MVANLSSHKRGWEDQWEEFSKMAQTGQEHINTLEELVDEDTRAFNDIMNAFRLKSQTEKEKKIKEIAIQEATVNAINIPLKIMNNSLELMHLIEKLVIHGNTNSVSDVGVAALCARSAVLGGYLNVLINAKDLTDLKIKDRLIKEAEDIREKTIKQENKIIDLTLETIQNSP
jgi:glutamate formiminotransferase/formiminotetrahydrofolate cyclodeaminase